MKLQAAAIGILLSLHVFASGHYSESTSQDQPWSVVASLQEVASINTCIIKITMPLLDWHWVMK